MSDCCGVCQVYSLLMAQLVLAALLALNTAWWGTGCLLLLMPITWIRAQSFAAHFEPLAAGFSLQQCAELDAEQWYRAKKEGKTAAPHSMPSELEELLRKGRDEYDSKARGQGPDMRSVLSDHLSQQHVDNLPSAPPPTVARSV